MNDIDSTSTLDKGSNRQLRHEIRDALAYTEISEQVNELLAGRVGMSFEEQRANVKSVLHLLGWDEEGAGDDDNDNFTQARKAAKRLFGLINAREAEYNKQFTPAYRLQLAQAKVASLKVALDEAQADYNTAVQEAAAVEAEVEEDEATLLDSLGDTSDNG